METNPPLAAERIAERVRCVVADYFGLDITSANDGALVRELSPGIDSLDMVECVMHLEEELRVEIPDDRAAELYGAKLSRWIEYAQERLASRV